MALETQDNNLLACRFYAKCGFVIGAVNTMLYRNFDNEEFKWLDEAGFVMEQECGDYQGHPISERTNRVIIWARKVR